MKRIKQWLVPLLVVAMVLGCTVPAVAAEGKSPVSLTAPESVRLGDEVEVKALADEAGSVADGVLVIRYDAEKLTYEGTQAGPAWSDPAKLALSVNSGEEGKVVLAFASSTTAAADVLFTLRFTSKGAGEAVFAVADGYVSGADKPAAEAKTEILTPVGHAVVFDAGSHGAFEDGKTSLTVEVADGETLEGKVPAVTPDGGFALAGWRKSDDGAFYTSEALAKLTVTKALTFTAVYSGACDGGEDCPTKDYTDLDLTGEAHAAVDYMVENGIMLGVAEATFAPKLEMNRAMLVTVLYRVAGSPAHGAECRFTDVKEGDWYYDAVVWALETGVTNGNGKTTFGPYDTMTREQLVTFLYRYAKLGGDVTGDAEALKAYKDAGEVSAWAQEAFAWAIGNGVIKGTDVDTLSPLGTATREQVALVIYRLLGEKD